MRRRVDPLADPKPLVRRVYAYVAYRIGSGADAEDVTSEVFERALRYRDSYDPARGTPAAWLVGIARRCIDDRRPATATLAAEDAAAPAFEDDVHHRLDLAAAVATLGARDRELIALRYGADLSARSIAATLDMSVNAVEVALSRALGRLRAQLGAGTDAPRTVAQPVLRSAVEEA
jgi:RNA polymerase sigma factor (sigma-70 family)